MRVVFMGTPEAAVPSLRACAEAFDVVAVYTRPDTAKGRGRRVSASPVKEAALELGLEVAQPKTLRKGGAAELAAFTPDAVAVVAYGMILPADVLAVPPVGCVNVHFSLLPRWRGAAPVERAVLAGDAETGVTTMLMDEHMDTGPMLLQERVPIGDDDTTGTLTARMADLGAGLLPRSISGVADGSLQPTPQPDDGVTIASKVTADEAELDLGRPAVELWQQVRAFDPAPGAYVRTARGRLKVWRCAVVTGDGEPGTICAAGDDGLDVQTADGRLRLLEVQPEGKRRLEAGEYVRGYRPAVGASLGSV